MMLRIVGSVFVVLGLLLIVVPPAGVFIGLVGVALIFISTDRGQAWQAAMKERAAAARSDPKFESWRAARLQRKMLKHVYFCVACRRNVTPRVPLTARRIVVAIATAGLLGNAGKKACPICGGTVFTKPVSEPEPALGVRR
jgi:hypothetical protein